MEEFTPYGEHPETEPAGPPRTDPADHQLYQRPTAATSDDDTDPIGFPPIPAGPAPRRTPKPAIAAAVVAVALLAGAIVTAALVNGPGTHRRPPAAAGNSDTDTALTGPLAGRQQAVFDLVDGTSVVRLHAASLGDDLYRVAAAAGGSVTPRVEQNGAEVKVYLRPTGRDGDGAVDITLNSAVRWTLRLNGGVASTVLDMTGGRVDAVDLAGGASRIELTLPRPQGLVAVRMTGGVDQFLVRLAELTPVRVRVGSGAGEVTVGGQTHHGIAAGRSFTAYGWNDGAAGVDLQAVAGMSALTVTG